MAMNTIVYASIKAHTVTVNCPYCNDWICDYDSGGQGFSGDPYDVKSGDFFVCECCRHYFFIPDMANVVVAIHVNKQGEENE